MDALSFQLTNFGLKCLSEYKIIAQYENIRCNFDGVLLEGLRDHKFHWPQEGVDCESYDLVG